MYQSYDQESPLCMAVMSPCQIRLIMRTHTGAVRGKGRAHTQSRHHMCIVSVSLPHSQPSKLSNSVHNYFVATNLENEQLRGSRAVVTCQAPRLGGVAAWLCYEVPDIFSWLQCLTKYIASKLLYS